ncbi:MAG: Ig-like domain-containing protein, partial [Candidatus Thermoplasmatota archaeon]
SSDAFIDFVQYKIDYTAWVSMLGIMPNWNATIAPNSLTEGEHTLYVRAGDKAGHTVEQFIIIYVDNYDPIVIVSSPSNDQYIEGTYTFKVLAIDTVGIERVNISVFNKTEIMAYNPATGLYEYTTGTIGINDGTYTVNATAYDKAGRNTKSASITFNVDNNFPTLKIEKPLSGEYIGGSSYNIEVNSSDTFIDVVQYKIDYTAWVSMIGVMPNWNATIVPNNMVEGEHTLYVRACDKAGHTIEQSVTIYVDNYDPIVIVSSPSNNQYIEGTYTFKVLAIDTVGINRVTIDVFNITLATTFNSLTGYYEAIVNTFLYDDGNYNLTAKAYDLANKTSVHGPVNFSIDNHYPVLKIISPFEGGYVSNITEINVSSTDGPFEPILEYRIDSTDWVKMGGSAPNFSSSLDTKKLIDGSHVLTVKAYDKLNHITQASINIIVDNNFPIVAIASPLEFQYIERFFTFKVVASDTVGIDSVIINISGSYYIASYNPLTGYYEYTINTILFQDGEYNVSSIAYDKSGKNSSYGPIKFYIDNTAPSLVVLNPIDGSFVNGTVEINVSSYDLFIYNVEYKIDEGNYISIKKVNDTWLAKFDTLKIADGNHKITIRAVDNLTHTTMQIINVIVDNNAPVCIITSPLPNQYLEGTITFKIAANDYVGIESVILYLFDSKFTATYNGISTYYEYTINTIIIDDGIYNLTAMATDLSGKKTIAGPINFSIDNYAPTLRINYPTSGKYISDNVTINATSSDRFLALVQYMIGTSVWIDLYGDMPYFEGVLDTRIYQDGIYTISVRAIDNASHVSTQSVIITIDNNDPTCILSSPVPNQYIEGTFTFKVTASDTIGIDRVVLFAFGEEWTAAYTSLTGYYEYTINTIMYKDDTYEIYASSSDKSGRTTITQKIKFNIDNKAPTLQINRPVEKTFVYDVYRIEVLADDEFMKVVEYRIDAMGWKIMDGEIPDWFAVWDTAEHLDGYHTITVRAIDNASHLTQQTITVIIDNNPPICIISAPVPNEFIEGVYTFKVSATDAVGIDYVTMTLFGSVVRATYNSQTGYYEYTMDTSVWPEDAIRNITATAYDLSGKYKQTSKLNFRVDNHAPSIKIISPKNKDFVSNFVNFDVNITDAFPGPVEYNIDGSGWLPIGLPWDTTLVADGVHTIAIRGRDLAEHITIQSLVVTVDNNDPSCIISSPVREQAIEGSFVFKILAIDYVGIREVKASLFGYETTVSYNSQTGYYEYTFDTTTQNDGIYNISAVAYDFSGKKANSTVVGFKLDNNPPDVTWVWPISGAYLSGEVRLNVIVNDSFLSSKMYTVDESGYVPLEKIFDTTLTSDGEHKLTVRAVDTAGHITSSSITVIVSNIAPETAIISPMENEHVAGIKKLQVYSSGAVKKALVSIDNGSFNEIFKGEKGYEYNIDTTTLLSGSHTITVKTIDFAEHVSLNSVNIVVDNDAPSIEIKKPKGGQKGSVEFMVIVTDESKIENVYIKLGETWIEMTEIESNTYTFDWITGEEDNGAHRYQIKALDALGNEGIINGRVIVENPTNYWKAFQDNLPGIAFIFFIALLIAFIISKRAKGIQIFVGKEKIKKEKMFITPGKKLKEEVSLIEDIKETKVEVPLVYECPNCNAKVKEEDKICPNCGVEFES